VRDQLPHQQPVERRLSCEVERVEGLQVREGERQRIESLLPILRLLAEDLSKIIASDDPASAEDAPPPLTPKVKAIFFVNHELKRTGRLPTKTAIAKGLEVDRRTLNNWTAFI